MQNAEIYHVLRNDIEKLRKEIWPPEGANHIDGLPFYYMSSNAVREYEALWQDVKNRAYDYLYPLNDIDSELSVLPSSLNIPLIFTNCKKVRINKTKAKESKTFRGLASLSEKCGSFSELDIIKLSDWLLSNDTAALVAHREFVDIRAYIYPEIGDVLRTRFYTNGLLIGCIDGFELYDHRWKVRKERNDAFSDPIAQNQIWKVYGRYR